MSESLQEAEELLDPTQMQFLGELEHTEEASVFAKMEEHLSVTARSVSVLTQQNREQMQDVAALGRMMWIIALAACLGALAILLVIIYLMRDIFALLAMAFLIAYMSDPLVSLFERRGANRTFIVAMFSLLLLVLVVISSLYLVESAITQIKGLIDNLPSIGETLRTRLYEWEGVLKLWLPSLQNVDLIGQTEAALRKYGVLEKLVPTAASFGGNIVPLLSGLAIVPFLTFFMLNNGRKIRKGFVESVPNRYFEPVLVLLDELDRQLGQYIRSRFLETAALSILAVLGLQLLGIRFAVILGVLLGVANLIPYFGPVLGTLPAALVALSGSHIGDWGILGVILLSFLIQFVDNAILFPLVVGKSVDLGPIATIVVVLIGSEFFGLVGLLLAVPIAAMLKAAVQIVYNEVNGYWRIA